MANESRHRIWAFAWLAWLALVAFPTTAAAIQWQRGIGRDPDMTGVVELILFLVAVLTIPSAIGAFGVIAPLAIAMDRAARGRSSRLANVALGGALGVLCLALFLTGGSLLWGRPNLWRVMQDPFMAVWPTAFVVAGGLVGLGLRERRLGFQ